MEYEMMDIHEVVEKLTGPIHPIGCTTRDDQRFENLKNTCDLIETLINDVKCVSACKSRAEYSLKRAGEYAEEFLNELLKDKS